MDLYKFHRSTVSADYSSLVAISIGSYIQENPDLILDFKLTRPTLAKDFEPIYHSVEKNKASRTAYMRVDALPREGLIRSLEKGLLLQAKAVPHTSIFGLTLGRFWRFNAFDGENASSLTIYENEREFKEALNKLNNPTLDLIRVLPKDTLRSYETSRIKASL